MSPVLKQKAPLVLLVAWCVAMLAVRDVYAHNHVDDFLLWNLGLALVPFGAAIVLRLLPGRAALVPLKLALFGAWLTFLPNAPYLVTDLVHLTHAAHVPFWYDIALFGSFAATGALLGYSSVADVDEVVSERFGKVWGVSVAFGSLLLCGFGIYLGRFLRWNSWDLLSAPRTLGRETVHQLAHPLSHPGPWQVSAVYGVGLVLGYLALRSLSPAVAPSARRSAR